MSVYEFRDQDLLGLQLLVYKIDYIDKIIPKMVDLNDKDLINLHKNLDLVIYHSH